MPRRLRTPAFAVVCLLGVSLANAAPRAQATPSPEAVHTAIDRGVAYLLARQNRDGSWDAEMHERNVPHHDYRSGPTALVLYTLVKCKVEREHPAIERALVYLQQTLPDRTYALSVEIQALVALDDEALQPRITELTKRLLDARTERKGGWEYPGFTPGQVDLSNTQYAALGLRAAASAGVKIPLKVWSDLAACALDFQEKPYSIDVALPAGETGTGTREIAGFCYKTDKSHAPSASMTAAGIATSAIATQALGKQLDKDLARRSERARAQALGWLDAKWSVDENVGGDSVWLYYYLYGLERIAALLEFESLGSHPWYAEGATKLLKLQKPNGAWARDFDTAWPPQPFSNGNTCFALLFLTRATAPRTGEQALVPSAIFTAEDPRFDVSIRAAGASKSRFVLTGFGAHAIERLGTAGERGNTLEVRAVRWSVDGQVVKELTFEPPRAWKDERFAHEHAFAKNGPHTIECAVDVLPPASPSVDGEPAARAVETLVSQPLVVIARDVLEPWMLDYAAAAAKNLLANVKRTAKASSQRSDRHIAIDACDGLQFTAWVAADDDRAATWTLELDKPLRAKSVWLSQAAAHAGQLAEFGRIARVAISCDDGKPIEFALDADPLRKTECTFAKPSSFKRLTIRVLELAPSSPARGGGFAEIELR
ncbi:MAG: hypothetical protein L6Q99_19810 [Planctomycetes bacterium]|nr:hypothetical protein [Planctomycetota bacterium]